LRGTKATVHVLEAFAEAISAIEMATEEEAGLFSFLALVPLKKQSPTPDLKSL
jgi:hypothetical protein